MNKDDLIQQLINAYSEAYAKQGYSSLMGKIVALLIASRNRFHWTRYLINFR